MSYIQQQTNQEAAEVVKRAIDGYYEQLQHQNHDPLMRMQMKMKTIH